MSTEVKRMAVGYKSIVPDEAERFKYRWIVLCTSFLIRTLTFGTLFSVGVLYEEWLIDFDAGRGETAWVGSIATGTTLLMGPISGVLLNKFSCRQVIICCGIGMSLGLIISSFASSIPYLCISFGVITGCAGGIANLAAIVSLGQYFDKQRPLAMGIGSGGVGVGAFLFGFLQEKLVKAYTWRGTMLVIGGIQLHVVICGLLMIHPNQLRHHELLWNWRKPSDMPFTNKVLKTIKEDSQLTNGDEEVTQSRDCHQANHTLQNNSGCTTAKQKTKRRRSTFQYITSSMRLTETTKSLWRNPIFLILFVSDFLSWLVQFVPYVHLPSRATMLGIDQGAILISILGITNALGKVGFGALCTFFNVSAFNVFLVAQTLFGLCTVVSPFCVTIWSLGAFAVCFGFLSGSYGLMMVIPAKLLGEDKFSLAYGFMLAGEGIGAYLGPPLVGWLTDYTESYDTSFYLAGCILLASAFVLMLKPLLSKLDERKRKIRTIEAWC